MTRFKGGRLATSSFMNTSDPRLKIMSTSHCRETCNVNSDDPKTFNFVTNIVQTELVVRMRPVACPRPSHGLGTADTSQPRRDVNAPMTDDGCDWSSYF